MKPRTAKAQRRAALAALKAPPPTLPKVGELVLVRYGSTGMQVAEVLRVYPSGMNPSSGTLEVRKWKHQSRSWGEPTAIATRDLRGSPAPDNAIAEEARAAMVDEIVKGGAP